MRAEVARGKIREGDSGMKRFALIASLLAVVVMAVLNLTYDFSLKPDAVYPMANVGIEWNTQKTKSPLFP